MKAKELIYNIQNLKAKGVQSQSSSLTDAQMLFIIDYYRATIIEQLKSKNIITDSETSQDLGKVELINVDKTDGLFDCEVDLQYGCLKRTKEKIPAVINDDYFYYVGTVDFLNPFTVSNFNNLLYQKHNKYTGKNPRYYYLNEYIYIENPPTDELELIRIVGVFNSTFEASKFKDFDVIDPFNYDYPIKSSMIDTIYKMILQSELGYYEKVLQDNSNNSKDDRQG